MKYPEKNIYPGREIRSFLTLSLVLSLLLITMGCTSDPVSSNDDNNSDDGDDNNKSTKKGWLIPEEDVVEGGPGKDGIPSIDNPRFDRAANVYRLDPDDLVIGIKLGDNVRVYPHNILDWHEIVNDGNRTRAFCITYCPLTGTAIAWNRIIEGTKTTFGVSGLLYKNNLIPYDRDTGSNWSQMLNLGVEGTYRGRPAQTLNIIETKWVTLRKAYPDAKVLSRQTGYNRNYDRYPYGDYKEDDDMLLFPVENKDDRLPNKDRVHGIGVDSSYVVYPVKSFGEDIKVINDVFKGKRIVVFGSKKDNIVESYMRKSVNGKVLTFKAVQDRYPVVMKSQDGTEWNIFGEAVSGPLKGTKLKSTLSYNGFWFAFADFFPDVKIRRP